MIWEERPPRAGSAHWVWLVALSGSLLFGAPPATAQVQPTPPAARPDTVRVPIPADQIPGDTIPEALRDSAENLVPPPVVPGVAEPLPSGWSGARWTWSREDLSRLPGLTLLEFLETLPGFVGFTAGGFGRPQGVTALGMGGGRMRVLVDGYELDPFGVGSFELETISLLDVQQVQVERSLSDVRVDVRTYRLDQPVAQSAVELGTGLYQTRVLRALFSRAIGAKSIATGAFDLVTTRGSAIREPYSHTSTLFRWAYVPTNGLALWLDWRRASIDREGTAYPRQTTRHEWVLHGSSQLSARFVVEALVGQAFQEDRGDETVENRRLQGFLRAAYTDSTFAADIAARYRPTDLTYPLRPELELEARASLRPFALAALEVSGVQGAGYGEAATSFRVGGTIQPVDVFSVFGSIEEGSRLMALPGDGTEEQAAGTLEALDVAGWRAGGEIGRGASILGVAAFETRLSPVSPFGLPFDRELEPVAVEPAMGMEGYARVAVPGTREMVMLDGWYAYMQEAVERPYFPEGYGRAAVVFRGSFYGGQLEPHLRIEGVFRNRVLVPSDASASFAQASGYQTLNLSLQIRILDVQAFMLWNNVLESPSALDIPGSPQSVARLIYGAQWRFRN